MAPSILSALLTFFVNVQEMQTIAASLMDVVAKYPVFLARWGGDGFLILSPRETAEPINDFCRFLKQEVADNARNRELPYDLSISVGYALCTSSNVSPTELTKKADRMLYEEKRIAHLTR